MPNRRSKLFWLSTMIIAGTAVVGCYEDDFTPQTDSKKETVDNITGNDISGQDLLKKLDPECYNSKKPDEDEDSLPICMTSSKCMGDQAYLACKCVVDKQCSTKSYCNGIVDSNPDSSYNWCNYECGKNVTVNGVTVDTCNWLVCANSEVCLKRNEGVCNPQTIGSDDPNGDYDQDGLTNRIEASNLSLFDPCDRDKDKDGVPDGLEDLNGDGKIDALLGETWPNDANSKPDIEGGEASARSVACDAKKMQGTFQTFNGTAVAQFNNASSVYKYKANPSNSAKEYVILDDADTQVYGFFFRDTISYEGKILIKKTLSFLGDKVTEAPEEMNKQIRIPEDSWLDAEYDKTNLQRVPNHTVKQFKYALTLNGDVTPSEVRDAIAKAVTETPDNVDASTSKPCTSGKIRVYLARADYEKDGSTIYSFGVACSESIGTSGDAYDQMEDIISSTMVASASYKPFVDFMCQTKVYGDASGAVDFIWIVDNSGSMVDEQEAVAQTVETFTNRLVSSGIDYRLGVTTTDAYTIDEADENGGYDTTWPTLPNGQTDYPILLVSGMRPFLKDINTFGFLDPKKTKLSTIKGAFGEAVTLDPGCDTPVSYIDEEGETKITKGKNICGYGVEDGLKSLETVLERLSNPSLDMVRLAIHFDKWPAATNTTSFEGICKVGEDVAPNCFNNQAKGMDCYNDLMKYYEANVADTPKLQDCIKAVNTVKLRDEALKYIIWISDETSRQFKENSTVVTDNGQQRSNKPLQRKLSVCYDGYALTDGSGSGSLDITNPNGFLSMFHGACNPSTDPTPVCRNSACNPQMPENVRVSDDPDAKLYINEASVLSEIPNYTLADGSTPYRPQYDMLMYYMTSYLKYAGKGGIAGFAIVGDDKKTGGQCDQLIEGQTTGADYGYDYILTARYLSTFQKYSNGMYIDIEGNYNMSGSEGSFASICNGEYTEIVNNIMSDAIGRVASHNLKGYPISSTIRVALKNPSDDEAQLLERGRDWQYDAANNSITLSNVSASSDSYLAISYVLWKEDLG